MYETLFFITIGLLVGFVGGSALSIQLLKPLIGDDYEINKPKIKGEGNKLEVIQQNDVEKKQNIIKRILKRK